MPQARYENEEFWLRDPKGRHWAMLHVEARIEYSRRGEEWELGEVTLIAPEKHRITRADAGIILTPLFDLVEQALVCDPKHRDDIEAAIVEHEQHADEEAADYQIEQRREALLAVDGR